jgi:hypothetical protein
MGYFVPYQGQDPEAIWEEVQILSLTAARFSFRLLLLILLKGVVKKRYFAGINLVRLQSRFGGETLF